MANYTTLNIGAGGIRLLSFRGRRVQQWGSAPLSPGLVRDGLILRPKVVGAVIAGLFKSTGAPDDRVVVGLTGLSFVYRLLTLPRLAGGDESEAIRRAARQEMPLPLEELYLAWQAVGGSKEEQEFFVLGVPRRPVDSLRETLAEAGLKLSELELTPLALARAANRDNAIIVSLEPDCFDIVVVAGGMPVIMHTVTPAGERAGLDDNLRRLLDELDKTVEFYNGSRPREGLGPDTDTPLLLTGEMADAAVESPLLAQLPYPVARLEPPLALPANLPAASFTANIGLGLKRQPLPGRQPYRDINLDILTGERKALARRFRPSYVLLTLAAVVILGLLFPANHLRSQAHLETANLQADLNAASLDMEQALAAANRAAEMESRLEQVQADLAALQREQAAILGRGGDYARNLKLVTDALPAAAQFTRIRGRTGGIEVEGIADSPFTVVKYVVALEKLGEYPEVRIAVIGNPPGATANATATATAVSFQLVITRGGATE